MNSLLTQPSPPRRGTSRRGGGSGGGVGGAAGGGEGGVGNLRGNKRGSRGRRGVAAGGSRLASTKPINSADLSLSTPSSLANGEDTASEVESSEELESARQERFNYNDPGNLYEQVNYVLFEMRTHHLLAQNQERY